jgi:hypothetical protein
MSQTSVSRSFFLDSLSTVPNEDWRRHWPADKTFMLRMASKRLRAAIDKLHPPASVYLSRTVWADARSGALPLAAISQRVLLQLSALPCRCRITTLDLSVELPNANEGFGPEGAERLVEVLMECPELSCLDLAWNRIGDQGVRRLGAWWVLHCRALSHLCLKGNELEAAGVLSLLGNSNEGTGLSHLDLGYNRIGDEGARSLSRVLVNCRMLSHLDLCHNAIGSGGMEILARILGLCTALSHLDLGYNHIGAEGARVIAEALAHACSLGGVVAQCPALAHLDLSSNDIGAAGADSLAGVLAQCRALAYLKLAWNWIGNEGAERLAEVLGQCPALVHLDLEFNEIEAEGAQRLRESWLGEVSGLVLAEEDEDEDAAQNGSDEEEDPSE